MNSPNARTPVDAVPTSVPSAAWWVTLVLVALCSIFRGGNRAVPLIGLEWLALCALVLMLWAALGSGGRFLAGHPAAKRWALGVLLLAPLLGAVLQLVPWPVVGRLTTTPTATAFAYLSGLPVLACFAASLQASDQQARSLLKLWALVALVQAVLGLMQLGTGDLLYFDLSNKQPALGTFASKNTYSNLLVMAVPLVVWLLLGQAVRQKKSLWGWGLALFVLVVTLPIASSRAGIATGGLVLLLSVVLLPPFKTEGGRWRLWALAGAMGLIALVLAAGGLEWAVRFGSDRLVEDNLSRAEMRHAAAQAALAHLPLGSGLGSFPWVSSEFQPALMGQYWFDLAHSDYLQLLSDTGLLGLLWIGVALALFLLTGWGLVRRSLRGGPGARAEAADSMALACGLGLLAFGLHAWVDYPFHIPANAMMAATLAGLMWRERSGFGRTSYKK